LPDWTAELDGALWLGQTLAFDAPAARPASVRFQVLSASLVGCRALIHPRALRWDLCIGLAIAIRQTSAEGLLSEASGSRVDLGPQLSTGLMLEPIGPFAPRLGVSLRASPQRDRITYRDTATGTDRPLFAPDVLELSAFLGAAFVL
jgi:hypothetical protein